MPNTFLDAYFEGQRQRQQQKLQSQQLAQQLLIHQQDQAQQLQLANQQFGLQKSQFDLQDAAQKWAQQHQLEQEQHQREQETLQNSLAGGQLIASGKFGITPPSGVTAQPSPTGNVLDTPVNLDPSQIGVPRPQGEFTIPGLGAIHPLTVQDQAAQQLQFEQEKQAAESKQKISFFNDIVQQANAKSGNTIDPKTQAKLFMSLAAPNSTAVWEDLPKTFEGLAVKDILDSKYQELAGAAYSDPSKAWDPNFLKQISWLGEMRNKFFPQPAITTGALKTADELRQSKTYQKVTEALSAAAINPNAVNAGDVAGSVTATTLLKLGKDGDRAAAAAAFNDWQQTHPFMPLEKRFSQDPAKPTGVPLSPLVIPPSVTNPTGR